jgi:hypothetical protein
MMPVIGDLCFYIKGLVKNNFPKSIFLRDGPIVPARKIAIKDNLHVFNELITSPLSHWT